MTAIRALTCDNETDRRSARHASTVLTHLADLDGRGLGVSLPSEQWRPVADYEGLYEISNLGRLRSYLKRRQHPHLVKPSLNEHGYQKVVLRRDGKQTNASIHRLVAAAFCERTDPTYTIVRHLDGSRTNNQADNLAWGNRSQNNYDMVRHGTHYRASLGRASHCLHGHEYTPENTVYDNYPSRKGRGCRTCRRAVKDRQKTGPRVITHCKRGHEYNPENTLLHRGKRSCRACQRVNSAAHYQRKKAATL